MFPYKRNVAAGTIKILLMRRKPGLMFCNKRGLKDTAFTYFHFIIELCKD